MRRCLRAAAAAFPLLLFAACSDSGPATPTRPNAAVTGARAAAALPPVRISEFHYDNVGTDAGEAVEISGPAGTDVTGWQIVLYNGNGGASYTPLQTLTGTIPATCGTRGVIVTNYASNGIQNGSPDGIALVDNAGSVVEFLSYEGTFTATNGPASGLVSLDIGKAEAGTEPIGQSLQRDGNDVWSGPLTNTFGACNDNGGGPPPPDVAHVIVTPATATILQGANQAFTAQATDAADQPIAGVVFVWSSDATAIATVTQGGVATGITPGDANIIATAPNGIAGSAALHVNVATPPGLPDIRFSEIHYDNTGVDVNEAIEVEGPAGSDLTGWTVVLYDGNGGTAYSTLPLTGTIPATCSPRGVVSITYPSNGIQNGSPDGFALVNGLGQAVEFLSYEGAFAATDGPAMGMTSTDIIAQEASSSPVGSSLQRDASNLWTLASASIGGCNGGAPPPPPGNTITFTGRLPSDPPLPVGFQDQLFATVKNSSNQTVITTITWTSETPAIADIDQDGVFTALTAGSATFRATAADGITTATFTLPTRVGVASATALYAGNAEFGEPADGDPSDDFVLRHPEYTASYNKNRNTPNWVSYDLDPTHFGPEDRCDCFTFDPDLPAAFTHYTTADYTGSAAINGFSIDRGHMTRSFDRTSASLDNAFTFYFSNVVPQASDLNQGPWAQMENDLGDLVRFQNKEVYIVTGVAGNKGTLKNLGKIVIPATTWKVAVVMGHDQGLADVHTSADIQIIAVIMPNDPGVRNVDWHTYQTTVDAVEAASGYDLLALLPDQIEIAVESGTHPPVAAADGPYAANEGSSVAMSGAGSSDPDGDALTYQWDFGDGSTGTGASVAHTYAQDGGYTVQLTVIDIRGLSNTVSTSATVANVAPVVGAFAGATLFPGETYTATGSFTDPGADPWSATVNYGEGGGATPLALTGKTFALSHLYHTVGTFTVTVAVADDDVAGSAGATVTVQSQSQGIQAAIALIDQLRAAGKLKPLAAISLKAGLTVAKNLADRGRNGLARAQLQGVVAELDLLVRLRQLAAADEAPVRALLVRLIASLAT